jgi:hypothetical protein
LGLTSHPIFVSVYDPWVENEKMIGVGRDAFLEEIGETLSEAGWFVAAEIRGAFHEEGFLIEACASSSWCLPDFSMLREAHKHVEGEEGGRQALPLRETLYVGPKHEGATRRAIDQWAAQNAGMQFLSPERLDDLLTMVGQTQITPTARDDDDWDPFLDSDDLP